VGGDITIFFSVSRHLVRSLYQSGQTVNSRDSTMVWNMPCLCDVRYAKYDADFYKYQSARYFTKYCRLDERKQKIQSAALVKSACPK
jgi:hypothetical protein